MDRNSAAGGVLGQQMARMILIALAMSSSVAPAAQARLLYHRSHTNKIVAAHDDGSHARLIARGRRALLAPNGRHAIVSFPRRRTYPDLRVVATTRGRARVLLHKVEFEPGDDGPEPGWSPDSRHVVAGRASDSVAFVIDTRNRRRRDLDQYSYGSGSFSPDGQRLALAIGDISLPHSSVFVYGMNSHKIRQAFHGGDAVQWGSGGLAYWNSKGLMLRRRPRSRPRLLVAHPARAIIRPVDWSANGRRLLAQIQSAPGEPRHAVIVNPKTRAAHVVPGAFEEVADLSRNGRRILGVMDGNVVAVAPNGHVRVLARDADSPGWNR
jgi:hypothetical protein